MLSVEEFNLYSRAIEVLEAREFLSSLKIADWPNMKQDARTKLHGQTKQSAERFKKSSSKKGQKISNADLAKILTQR